MIRQIDHIVIIVQELEQGIADYSSLGFTVVRGGEHPGGATHNALVVFGDGTYFELIAFMRPSEGHNWWDRGQRIAEGLLDYALLPGAIADDIAAARARGLEYAGPLSGGRLRPDGVKVEWQTGRAATTDLPFLCFDLTPRELRVPEGALRNHANGATGVAAITVAIADLERSAARYRALLGDAAQEGHDPAYAGDDNVSSVAFQLGAALITLVQPVGADGLAAEIRARLDQAGDGPYAVTLRGPQVSAAPLDVGLAHGAKITFGG